MQKSLYSQEYYSFNTYNIGKVKKEIKETLIRYSVAKSLGYKKWPSFLFSRQGRNGGAHALKGRIKSTNSILDIGCGDGSLVKALHWNGFKNLVGIDLFLQTELPINGLSSERKSIQELEHNKKFDVIMLHHSLEHMPNPKEIFSHISRLLKEDGVCIIRIPVADSFAFEKYGKDWVQMDAPRHCFLHTNTSINLLATEAGLKVTHIDNDSSSFQFIGSEQYRQDIDLTDPRSVDS